MIIKIIYGAPITSITGKHIEEISIEKDIEILDLINILINKYGPNFKDVLLTEKNEVKPNVLIILNGKTITKLNEVRINNDSTLSITGIFGGG